MTLDIPVSSINLNLDPATKPFDSKDVNITVGTNNKTGYWISMSSSTGESDLVNIDDNTKTISTIATAGSYTSLDFPINQWGYKIDSGNYTPFVSGATIKSSNTTANGETFKLNIASKIDYIQPSGTYNMALNIKMLPNMIQEYMQDITPDMCTEDPSVVMDKRDGQTYTIARLKDGKCWMTQNLKLGKYTDSLTLTSEDSNVGASGFTLNGKLTDGKFINEDASVYYCTDNYGCYYNWFTATAGSGTIAVISGDADYSICPKSWVLPTGGESGDFVKMAKAYGYGSDAVNIVTRRLLVDPVTLVENTNGYASPGFLLTGLYRNSGPENVGNGSEMWSRSACGENCGAHRLYMSTNALIPANGGTGYIYAGRPVRCLLKES